MRIKPVVFVPMRGGSKGIPGKNIMPIGPYGRLVYEYSVIAGLDAGFNVLVSTNDIDIADSVCGRYQKHPHTDRPDVDVLERPCDISGDSASIEDAMLHHINNGDIAGYTHVIMMQVTNLFARHWHVRRCASMMDEGSRCVVSTVNVRQFRWIPAADNWMVPTYEPTRRPSRHEHDGTWLENGAIYGFSIKDFLETEPGGLSRIPGTVDMLPMPAVSLYELDEPEDAVIIDALLRAEQEHAWINPEWSDLYGEI